MSVEEKSRLFKVIRQFAEELSRSVGPQMYDFGDGWLAMPVPDFETGNSFLTKSFCYLYTPGPEALKNVPSPVSQDKVTEADGWKFIAVEFTQQMLESELWKKLRAAKAKLEE